MGYVTPPAAVVGQPADVAADWNAMRDAVEAVAKPALAILSSTTVQGITNTTWTGILFNAEDPDTVGGHSTSTNTTRYTVQAGWAGYYHIAATVSFAPNATGARFARVRKNGGTVVLRGASALSTGGALTTEVGLNGTVYLAVGDYVELQVYQSSGGTLNTANTDSSVDANVTPRMSIRWVSA